MLEVERSKNERGSRSGEGQKGLMVVHFEGRGHFATRFPVCVTVWTVTVRERTKNAPLLKVSIHFCFAD
jgi:hypothetical protein